MEKSVYIPAPIDTSDIELPEELMELAELISKNVHEVWSQGRMAQGWTYGPERDDTRKEHPCLVPYEQLSDSEKAYDRNTALATLRLIRRLGFSITRE